MAELRIQPKKKSPSPWLLVAIAVLVLGAAAYFFLRPDPTDEPAPAAPPAATAPADTLATTVDTATTAVAPTPAAPAADSSVARATAAAGGAGATLLQLRPQLMQLTDRADLRDDATIREQRDNFTSATDRLADGDPRASLRPGLVAAANLLLAVQQKGYPNLQNEANALTLQASQLSGRDATPAEQAQNQAYLTQVHNLLNTLSYPAKDVL
jgi:hypothetical protein